ncbi:FAD-dependent oxidoreductase [Desulfovibrio ferrophilus]|uniref:FAD-dependent pyridine nucleotide-disulphide oxidoreductase n=1 Tax=Desulfovibrio ferrophilus TaxID=241368 RepID=A0A2Z6AU71_9BACT|nr:FAD-dependent oxidoreductase [Desulfovibrio ferrophilus]BBD06775.1 FAD-dependent pyridine nucleotide-disulphide oxidoreductase [Desulfovibrio ferrophilus]
MPKKIVIIGAVALGPKAACRARRLDPEAEITVVDRDSIISYGGCGIPYYVSGDIAEVKELCSTVYHAVRDPEFFRQYKRVNVLTRTEAISIDRKAKTVLIKSLETGKESELEYDSLVFATGSTPFVPPVPGHDLQGVFTVSNLHKATLIKDKIAAGEIDNAVVVGGGAIGLEMAEALTALWGIKTTVVEMCDHVLPQAFGPGLARMVENHLRENDVDVMSSTRLLEISGDADGRVAGVKTDKGEIPCQLVIFGVGARPNTQIGQEAGLAVGPWGGLLVDARMRTSDPSIYAGGDCCEVRNLITGGSSYLPLGSLANRQGRVIGTNVAGGNERFEGAVGTFCLKAFELGVAKAGLTLKQARDAGFDAEEGMVVMADRAHFFPGNELMFMSLIADRKTRRVLGIEAVGPQGDAVKARVDAVAVLLPHKPDLDDISNLEVGYAPPYASAMDIVNAAGNALKNIMDGFSDPIDPVTFLEMLEDENNVFLDVRAEKVSRKMQAIYGDRWICLPQDDLPARWEELPRDKRLHVFCNTGLRSYESQLFLREKGFTDLKNIAGGYATARLLKPGIDEK